MKKIVTLSSIAFPILCGIVLLARQEQEGEGLQSAGVSRKHFGISFHLDANDKSAQPTKSRATLESRPVRPTCVVKSGLVDQKLGVLTAKLESAYIPEIRECVYLQRLGRNSLCFLVSDYAQGFVLLTFDREAECEILEGDIFVFEGPDSIIPEVQADFRDAW